MSSMNRIGVPELTESQRATLDRIERLYPFAKVVGYSYAGGRLMPILVGAGAVALQGTGGDRIYIDRKGVRRLA